jgi:hypothetical protein
MTVHLPLDPTIPRRWSVAEHSGDMFEEDDDFDGIALTIEIHSQAEWDAVESALAKGWQHE